MKDNLIMTICDAKYGDFLVNHWLRSLKDNVDLKNIAVVVFDYGLTNEQVSNLKKEDIIVKKYKKDGHVNVIRFRDLIDFLSKNKYKQIMSVDGGDIIFQKDISPVFKLNPTMFRAVEEDISAPFEDFFLSKYFDKKKETVIKKTLENKKMVNCGVLIGPRNKFMSLCKEVTELILDKTKFGPDQVAVNYILHRDGFVSTSKGYNFLVETMAQEFYIKKGVFYYMNKEKIPIVHNAGRYSLFRPIKKFGYGPKHNKLKKLIYHGLRFSYTSLNFFDKLLKKKAK